MADKWKPLKVQLKNNNFLKMEDKHMMGTVALHQLGDISSDEPDICVIYGDDGDYWVGQWIYGYGFFNVRYPKETTRELTEEEYNKYNDRGLAINGNPVGNIKIKGYTRYEKQDS